MAKKDFSAISTKRVFSAIAEATQEEQETRKPRRTYTEQEAAEFIQDMKTSGRKGVKLKRINLAFADDTYKYVNIMARVSGESMTTFINKALRQHMEEHADTYQKALAFREELEF